jgi:hypothetical protein
MDPNTHSMQQPGGIGLLAAVVDELTAEDLDTLPDSEAARRVLVLRRLIERLEGQWLRELAGVDAAAPPTPTTAPPPSPPPAGCATGPGWATPTPTTASGSPAPCTAPPARHRPGPGRRRAQRPARGGVDPQYPAADGGDGGGGRTGAAGGGAAVGPPGLRKVVGHLGDVADPDAADQRALRRHDRRGLWVAPTLAGMVAVDGLLDAEAGETLLTAVGTPGPPQHR